MAKPKMFFEPGDKARNLTILERVGNPQPNKRNDQYRVRCTCGYEWVTTAQYLRQKVTERSKQGPHCRKCTPTSNLGKKYKPRKKEVKLSEDRQLLRKKGWG